MAEVRLFCLVSFNQVCIIVFEELGDQEAHGRTLTFEHEGGTIAASEPSERGDSAPFALGRESEAREARA